MSEESFPDSVSIADEIERVDRAVCLFRTGETVTVAVSGGCDSVALLRGLATYAPKRRLSLRIAHLDHSLRPESAAEARFVSALAAELSVGCTLGKIDVGRIAEAEGWSIEEAARRARYSFLAQVSWQIGASAVALGHQADDQAETVLMNFIRGAGLDGLKGMTPVGRFPLDGGEIAALLGRENLQPARADAALPRIVRPLLFTTRSAIEGLLEAGAIAYVEDSSNLDRRMLRNRLRHEVLPLLEEINPGLRRTLVRNASLVASDLSFLEQCTSEALGRSLQEVEEERRFSEESWRDLHPAVQRRLIRREVARLGLLREFGARHVEEVRRAIADGRRPAGLPANVQLRRSAGWFALGRGEPRTMMSSHAFEPIAMEVPGEARLPGRWELTARVRERRHDDPSADLGPWRTALDADVVGTRLEIRCRRPGDRMRPLGMGGHRKKLQDLFVDRRVPRKLRDGWPIVEAEGEIVWVPGLSVSHSARLTDSSRRVLRLDVGPTRGTGPSGEAG